jgi:hypothetical protein
MTPSAAVVRSEKHAFVPFFRRAGPKNFAISAAIVNFVQQHLVAVSGIARGDTGGGASCSRCQAGST